MILRLILLFLFLGCGFSFGGWHHLLDRSDRSPLLRLGLMSLFPLISSVAQLDRTLLPNLLSTLSEVVHSMPILALQNEPADCLNGLVKLLESMAVPQQDDATISTAVDVLIELSLLRGSLGSILATVKIVRNLLLAGKTSLVCSPALLVHVRVLHEVVQVLGLPLLGTDNYLHSFQHHAFSSIERVPQLPLRVHQSQGGSSSQYAQNVTRMLLQRGAVTGLSNGMLIVSPRPGVFLKIGTGVSGTISGHVYTVFGVDNTLVSSGKSRARRLFSPEALASQENLLQSLFQPQSDPDVWAPAVSALVSLSHGLFALLPLNKLSSSTSAASIAPSFARAPSSASFAYSMPRVAAVASHPVSGFGSSESDSEEDSDTSAVDGALPQAASPSSASDEAPESEVPENITPLFAQLNGQSLEPTGSIVYLPAPAADASAKHAPVPTYLAWAACGDRLFGYCHLEGADSKLADGSADEEESQDFGTFSSATNSTRATIHEFRYIN
jgi:hypothetical protein